MAKNILISPGCFCHSCKYVFSGDEWSIYRVFQWPKHNSPAPGVLTGRRQEETAGGQWLVGCSKGRKTWRGPPISREVATKRTRLLRGQAIARRDTSIVFGIGTCQVACQRSVKQRSVWLSHYSMSGQSIPKLFTRLFFDVLYRLLALVLWLASCQRPFHTLVLPHAVHVHLHTYTDMGVGQNSATRGLQVLVIVSVYQGAILGTYF